eukprot:TRINITY_DN4499_c0_g1_i1.p1 TRINITY_DN4499_c0_g1~~TRINITY_DN4499_c0_g1_i1.p1  ORF type:complete len:89 (-),score=10.95 TRINITY_DN4499_c0_g1_i1:45-311(-)
MHHLQQIQSPEMVIEPLLKCTFITENARKQKSSKSDHNSLKLFCNGGTSEYKFMKRIVLRSKCYREFTVLVFHTMTFIHNNCVPLDSS